jgi:hypothetical protein
LEIAQGRVPAPAVSALVKELLGKVAELNSLKPEEAKPARQKLVDEFFKKQYKDKPHFDLAWVIFDQAVADDSPSAENIRFLDELLRAHDKQSRYPETLLLRRLGELAADAGKKWRPEIVHWALRAAQEGERAHAADPATLPWIRPLVEEAAGKRLQGEILLFEGGAPSKLEKARMLLQSAEGQYQEINNLVQALEEARRGSDEAMSLLPGFAPYLLSRAQIDSVLERDWIAAASEAGSLRQLLARPAEQPLNAISDLQRHVDELRRSMNSLHRSHSAEQVARLIKLSEKPDMDVFLEIQALLESPRLGATERKALWQAAGAMAGQLDSKAAASGPTESARATQRARLAIHWLKVGGFTAADDLEKTKLPEVVQASSAAGWEGLGSRCGQPGPWKCRASSSS